MRTRIPTIGLMWTQFAPYHVDRCEAVAARLKGKAEVIAVEGATTSTTYAWDPSGDVAGARKVTLFPGESYLEIGWWRRFRAQFRTLRRCHVAYIGISYGDRDIILLAFMLRLLGTRVVMMTESKFDDMPRSVLREFGKMLLMLPYAAALVGGNRQESYVRFLGFRRRPVLTGYDAVNLDRVRAMGGGVAAPDGPAFAERNFIFVGRFVRKKCVPFLVDAYARYVALSKAPPRKLILIGSGETEADIHARIAEHGLESLVEVKGFLQAEGVARTLASGLALILPSDEEQWGLVVNEALAFNLPILVSENVGSRDFLVRNFENGYVVERGSEAGFARAMLAIADSESEWRRLVEGSRQRSPFGHTDRFAEAVDAMLSRLMPRG